LRHEVERDGQRKGRLNHLFEMGVSSCAPFQFRDNLGEIEADGFTDPKAGNHPAIKPVKDGPFGYVIAFRDYFRPDK
jgi:hypothetical protein